ncbi:MAG: RNA polymerase sigma factor [Candidatus Omnitrophica bacterium]|nr:RNA polymerase sigma factor [Candidatus Omnitrophota bacterium]
MIEVSDDIIKRAASGDRDAFEDIYKRTSGYVYAVALRVSGNTEDAQEVVQDVFMALYKGLWKFNFKAKLTTWMYRITVNTAINYCRRSRKRKMRESNDATLYERIGKKDDPSLGIEAEETEKKLMLLLAKLKPEQRVCIILREIEQMTYEEIAKTLKIKLNTVRTRIKRARETLIKCNVQKEEKNEM